MRETECHAAIGLEQHESHAHHIPHRYYSRECDTGVRLSAWLTLLISEWRGHRGTMVDAPRTVR
jgi:hypothetical protein